MPATHTMTAEDYKAYFEKAISYEQYQKNFAAEIVLGDASPYAQYLPQNWSRQSRLDRKLTLSESLIKKIQTLQKPVHWLVITEHWCGDASQINPVVAKAAALSSGKINLRFIYRDENEALIDAHLTNGRSRSIPMVLQLDKDYHFVGRYGPRPAEAQELVLSLKEKGEDYNVPLHTWYARDRQQAVQADLGQLLKNGTVA